MGTLKGKHPIWGVERKVDCSVVKPKENVYTQEVKHGRSYVLIVYNLSCIFDAKTTEHHHQKKKQLMQPQ